MNILFHAPTSVSGLVVTHWAAVRKVASSISGTGSQGGICSVNQWDGSFKSVRGEDPNQ